uniref:Fibronectin type-III domain-containing protein n=1 Tax=Syphacia muris TaxID=451379 RepID=A0A0N5AQ37_9BILA
MKWFSCASLLLCLCQHCESFLVLPFVQIDFTHYYRLAQCNAKCAAKVSYDLLKEKNFNFYLNYFKTFQNFSIFQCEIGCNKGRRPFTRVFARSPREALEDGIQFWQETIEQQTKSGTSPIKAVRVGCMNVITNNENSYEDGFEASVFIDITRRYDGPIRYVVQWKQKITAYDKVEESDWITASVESQPYFKVEGMMPRTQYSFKVAAVNPKGCLGNSVISEWVETIDNGVSALVLWSHLIVDDKKNDTSEAVRRLGSCYLQVAMANATYRHTTSFVMDNGEGFLLTHLEFASAYSLSVSALPSVPADEESLLATASVVGRFYTMTCNEVFGPGSIKCPPEPVRRLRIHLLPNGTADVQWIPSTDPSSILVYQLFYTANTAGCMDKPVNTYLNAFSSRKSCEYLVRLINYDIYGRDAASEIRVQHRPRILTPTSNILPVIVSASLLLFFIVLLKLFSYFSCQLQGEKVSLDVKTITPIV